MSVWLNTASLSRFMRTAAAGWCEWAWAWLSARDNPVAAFMELTEIRRQSRIPLWRRLLWPGLLFLPVVLAAIVFLTWIQLSSGAGGSIQLAPGQLGRLLIITAVVLLAILYLIYSVSTVVGVAMGVFRALADPAAGIGLAVLDDMAATSLLSDRELTAGICWHYWPRLLLVSLLGGALVCMLNLLHGGNVNWLFSLALPKGLMEAPLHIAAMLLSGGLAGMLYLHCLIALGQGLRRIFSAVMIAAVIGCNFFLYMIAVYSAALTGFDGSLPEYSSAPVGLIVLLIMSVLFFAAYTWMLDIAEPRPGFRKFLLGSIFLLIAGWFLFVAFTLFLFDTESSILFFSDDLFAASYHLWSSLALVKPMAQSGAGSFAGGAGTWGIPVHYAAGLLVQAVLIMITARYARRAIRQRRTTGPWRVPDVNRQLDAK